MKHLRMQSNLLKPFQQLWNLTFLTLDNDVRNIEKSSNILKFNFSGFLISKY